MRSPVAAVWLAPVVLAADVVIAFVAGASVAALVLVVALVVVAGVRWVVRREPPEGFAVRPWPVDVGLLVLLAAGITVLVLGPGV